jgi:hypothetical protein
MLEHWRAVVPQSAQSQLILILCLDRGCGLHKVILYPLGSFFRAYSQAGTLSGFAGHVGLVGVLRCQRLGDLKLIHQTSSFFRSEDLIGLFPSLYRI